MTKEMTNETVKYLITLKIEQVEELRKAMESAGIPFNLTEDMIGMPTDNIMEDIYMGRDAEYLTDKVNEYLEEQGKPERITQPFEEMDIRSQRDLLLLGSIHSDWQKESIQEISPREWEKFQERHPETMSEETSAHKVPRLSFSGEFISNLRTRWDEHRKPPITPGKEKLTPSEPVYDEIYEDALELMADDEGMTPRTPRKYPLEGPSQGRPS